MKIRVTTGTGPALYRLPIILYPADGPCVSGSVTIHFSVALSKRGADASNADDEDEDVVLRTCSGVDGEIWNALVVVRRMLALITSSAAKQEASDDTMVEWQLQAERIGVLKYDVVVS